MRRRNFLALGVTALVGAVLATIVGGALREARAEMPVASTQDHYVDASTFLSQFSHTEDDYYEE